MRWKMKDRIQAGDPSIFMQYRNMKEECYNVVTIQGRKRKKVKLGSRIWRQIQDMHAIFWHKTETEAQSLFAKLHIPSLLQGGWNWAHFCSTMYVWAAVSEILADFLNFHIWPWNLKFEEMSQSFICTLFLPQWGEIKPIFCSTGSRFRYTNHFSKFPLYLGMKSGIWRKVPTLHMYSLSTPGGQIKLIFV